MPRPAHANQRRQFLAALGLGCGLLPLASAAQDRWGQAQGFPSGWGPPGATQKWEGYEDYHVGNFSGGLENLFAHQTVHAGGSPSPLVPAPRRVKIDFFTDASDYAAQHNVTGLLIARDNAIWHEEYRFERKAQMRFFGWSMTKSVLGLLVGIALEQKKIASLDDRLDQHIPQLARHPFADIRLRHLLNMSSGIDICEAFCSPNNGFERYGHAQIGHSPRRGQGTDQIKALLEFPWGRSEAQGQKFNYTDINPVLVAWVMESVYQQPLARIAEQQLWQPMGAAADATWLTDAQGFTFSGAGFSATLQDWARLGLLVAHGGRVQERQVVPQSWIDQTHQHGAQDQASRFNVARPQRGYKNFFWHHTADGRVLRMAGHHAQNILIDPSSKTVLVQTSVGAVRGGDEKMAALFAAACRL